MQTIRGGAALRAAVSDVIAVFIREENKDREKVKVLIHYLQKGIQYVLCTHCVLEELYFIFLSVQLLFLDLCIFIVGLVGWLWGVKGQRLQLRRHCFVSAF